MNDGHADAMSAAEEFKPDFAEVDDDWDDFEAASESDNVAAVVEGQPSTSEAIEPAATSNEPNQTDVQCPDGADDDWGDDDFADFQEAVPQQTISQHSDQSQPEPNTNNLSEKSPQSNGTLTLNISEERVNTVIRNAFKTDSPDEQENVEKEIVLLKNFGLSDENNSSAQTVWKALQENDAACTLKFKWTTSKAFERFLDSLKIDPSNISPVGNVPKFASGLGLLEPTVRTNNRNESLQSTRRQQLNAAENMDATLTVTNKLSTGTEPSLGDIELDLDFLDTRSSSSKNAGPSSLSTLEDELLSDTSEQPNRPVSKLNIIDDLLASASSSPFKTAKSTHSTEALLILNELPDLSFMTENELIFPTKGSVLC